MTTATQTDKRIRRYTPLKRTLDILLSGIGILVLSPILLILCIAIKLESPGPILFRQKRVGIHKTHFQFVSAVDLCPAGQPGEDLIGTVFITFRDQVILVPQCRTGTHDAHISLEDIEDLRKFIQAGFT